MTAEMFDFQFGWRWLLPLTKEHSIRLFGFSTEEEQFWNKALSAADRKNDTGQAEVLLIDGDRCAAPTGLSDEQLHAAQVVGVISSRAHADHWQQRVITFFPLVREYGLLPADNPRVVAPLATARQTSAALELHRPGRLVARLGLLLARMLVKVGNCTLLRGRVLLIATRVPNLLPQGAVQANLPAHLGGLNGEYALYLGSPDNNRKTVVLPLGAAAPEMLLKVAATPTAGASLLNEADALAALAGSSLAQQVPKLLDMVEEGNTLTLYQEYRPRKFIKQRRLNEALVAFLGKLSRLNAHKQSLTHFLAALPPGLCDGVANDTAVACRAILTRLQTLAESGAVVVVHRSHGDFAPWNCSWTAQGLFVFDWEASLAQDIAFGDAFYYAIAPALLVQQGTRARTTLVATLRLARQVAIESGIAETEVPLYLALWLLQRLRRASFYGDLLIALERHWS